jgi:copper chaperone CopZ
MKKVMMAALVSMVLSTAAIASTAKVTVKGMVCAFCAQGIKKTFSKEEAVKKVDVSLEKKIVDLEFRDGKNIADDKIAEIITNAGYNVEKIERKK